MGFEKKLLQVVFLILSAPLVTFAFSREDIISPAEGTWANVQPLVLNTQDGSDVYFSLTGSDPYEQGFFYDGPVVIDATGPVTVRITSVSPSGQRSDFSVSYNVLPVNYSGSNAELAVFIQNISQSPIQRLVGGEDFVIPESLTYSAKNGTDPYLKGRKLTLNEDNSLDRYIPLSVTDGFAKYHFVLHAMPHYSDPGVVKEVPFKIDSFTKFTYTGQMLIYQIDDSYWSADTQPLELDRNETHTVRWQSVAYEKGNPVYTYELTPLPQVLSAVNADGSMSFWYDSVTGYKLATKDSAPASKVTLDTVYGDHISGNLKLRVFYDNVLQGEITMPYDVDRSPPEAPVISTSAKSKSRRGMYERSEVHVRISAEEDARVYYAVSSPYTSPTGFEEKSRAALDAVVNDSSSYKLYDGHEITLSSRSEMASFYRLNAYAVDSSGNKSSTSEYTVIVDEYNYYLSTTGFSQSASSEPDGSYSNPFTNFAQAVKAINSRKDTRLHIAGNVNLPEGETKITGNCIILANSNHLVLPPYGTLVFENADVTLSDCILEKRSVGTAITSLTTDDQKLRLSRALIAKNAKVSVNNCELVGVFALDGILFDSESSSLNLQNSGLTVQADSYTSAVNAFESKVNASNLRVTSVANTCVNFSLTGGTFSLEKSTTSLIGYIGRSVELSSVKARLLDNMFSAQLESTGGTSSVWKDSASVLEENSGNDENGF